MFTKKTTYRSKRYMDFTRQQECPITMQSPCDPHHSITGGMGIKCTDLACIPLAHFHHSEIDSIGDETFQRRHNVDFKDILIVNLMRYICHLEGHNPDEYAWPRKLSKAA